MKELQPVFLVVQRIQDPRSQRGLQGQLARKASENKSYQKIIEKPQMAAMEENEEQQEYVHHPSL